VDQITVRFWDARQMVFFQHVPDAWRVAHSSRKFRASAESVEPARRRAPSAAHVWYCRFLCVHSARRACHSQLHSSRMVDPGRIAQHLGNRRFADLEKQHLRVLDFLIGSPGNMS
jgi:hypothetical protein